MTVVVIVIAVAVIVFIVVCLRRPGADRDELHASYVQYFELEAAERQRKREARARSKR